jgi:hypothetical protein
MDMELTYSFNRSNLNDVLDHLSTVDNSFSIPLSDRVNLKEYSNKLFENACRFEAWCEGSLVGLVAFYYNDNNKEIYVSNVSVVKQFAKKGIAASLMLRLDEYSVQHECRRIRLEAAYALFPFYKNFGYDLGRFIREDSYEMIKYVNSSIPVVSICCTTYNHAQYIRQCLDGFIMQQTSFGFEILIHDDASTDETAEIIREYEREYPKLFKPIFQSDNQYSKGLSISATYNFPRAKGKYIAFCEGDDYWTDSLKLQKQVDFMEEHEDVFVCFHKVNVIVPNEPEMIEDFHVIDVPEKSSLIDLVKIGNYIPTNSGLYRNDRRVFADINRLGTNAIGDYALWIMCSQYGKIYKLPDNMAVYRYGVGSWQTTPKIYQYINILNLLNRLRMILQDAQVVQVIDERIRALTSQIIDIEHKDKEQLRMIKETRTYRIGSMITKPIKWLRDFF